MFYDLYNSVLCIYLFIVFIKYFTCQKYILLYCYCNLDINLFIYTYTYLCLDSLTIEMNFP